MYLIEKCFLLRNYVLTRTGIQRIIYIILIIIVEKQTLDYFLAVNT